MLSRTEQLEKLARLRAEGSLTEDQYESEKQLIFSHKEDGGGMNFQIAEFIKNKNFKFIILIIVIIAVVTLLRPESVTSCSANHVVELTKRMVLQQTDLGVAITLFGKNTEAGISKIDLQNIRTIESNPSGSLCEATLVFNLHMPNQKKDLTYKVQQSDDGKNVSVQARLQ